MTNKSKKYTLQEARLKAEEYCAYQERCHSEVKTKLFSWNLDTDHVEAIMLHLIQNNFLNEERFAHAYVSGKFQIKKWGKIKITLELKRKGIQEGLIKKSLTSIDETEYFVCLKNEYEKKYQQTKGKNEWERQMKVKKHLYGRGFEPELIDKVIDKL